MSERFERDVQSTERISSGEERFWKSNLGKILD